MTEPDVTADWLLSAAERDNPASAIDGGRDGGRPWTVGNRVQVHADGAAYFADGGTQHHDHQYRWLLAVSADPNDLPRRAVPARGTAQPQTSAAVSTIRRSLATCCS